MRHAFRLTVFVSTVLMLGACGATSDDETPAAAPDATVTVEAFDFQPDPLVIAAGSVITFVNDDKIDHTVTAGTRDEPLPEVFDGQLPERGATFELALEEPGRYEYFCQIHPGPGMTATITVR